MSKRVKENVKSVERGKEYPLSDAVKMLKEFTSAKFDETVEMVVNLKIDVTQADQQIRGSFSFPHGTGKSVRVIAIVDDGMAEEAKNAGAVEAGGQDLIERIEKGWFDFDVVVAHPSMMRFVGKLGRTLGPKGLMPSPKSGTVVTDVAQGIKDFSAGKIEYRNDRLGSIQVPVGKLSFSEAKLEDNIKSFFEHIMAIKPSGVKGTYVKSIFVSSTMSPGVKIAM